MDSNEIKPKKGSFRSAFPDDETLKEMRNKFIYPNGDISTIETPPNAVGIERLKYKICHLIDGYRIERQMKQKEVAKLLQIDESRMSELMSGKLENYTIERLFGYLKILNPDYEIMIKYTGD